MSQRFDAEEFVSSGAKEELAYVHGATVNATVNGFEQPGLRVTLAWGSVDPAAVHLLAQQPTGDVTWRLSRDLLLWGGGAGGDVWVERGDEYIALHLSSPDGSAVLGLPIEWATKFLDATAEFVMPGSEPEHTVEEWTAGLAELLESGGA